MYPTALRRHNGHIRGDRDICLAHRTYVHLKRAKDMDITAIDHTFDDIARTNITGYCFKF